MDRKSFLKSVSLLPFLPKMNTLPSLDFIADSFSATDKMPALFLGHGSPMNAIDENEFVTGFRNVALAIPKPQAILCISAHWYIKGTKLTAMEFPKTIHDFGGFPQALFDVQYPAKGSPELAKATQKLLEPTPAELDDKWGLDHGAWSVIKHLYPKADVPVIQMSIDYSKPPEYHFELAKRLSALRRKGILLIGSGNIVHNLGLVDFRNTDRDNYGYDWAKEAREAINTCLLDENFKPLLRFQDLGKALQLAIPTPEHFLPLIYTIGLKEKSDSLSLFNDKLMAGSLSMTSVKLV